MRAYVNADRVPRDLAVIPSTEDNQEGGNIILVAGEVDTETGSCFHVQAGWTGPEKVVPRHSYRVAKLPNAEDTSQYRGPVPYGAQKAEWFPSKNLLTLRRCYRTYGLLLPEKQLACGSSHSEQHIERHRVGSRKK